MKTKFILIIIITFLSISNSYANNQWITKKENNQWITKKENNQWITKKKRYFNNGESCPSKTHNCYLDQKRKSLFNQYKKYMLNNF